MKPTPTQIDLALSKTPFIPNAGNRAWMAEALSAALSVQQAVVGEPVAKIKNDPDNYLTVGKVQSKIADERNRSPTSAAAWAFRDNGDDPWSFARDEPEICYEKRPLYDHPSIQGVVDADWWLVATDMGKVIFHGPDKDRADRVAAIHGREAQPLYAAHPWPDGYVRGHLHLIRYFADDMTERNWEDKRLYIKQQVDFIVSALGGSHE